MLNSRCTLDRNIRAEESHGWKFESKWKTWKHQGIQGLSRCPWGTKTRYFRFFSNFGTNCRRSDWTSVWSTSLLLYFERDIFWGTEALSITNLAWIAGSKLPPSFKRQNLSRSSPLVLKVNIAPHSMKSAKNDQPASSIEIAIQDRKYRENERLEASEKHRSNIEHHRFTPHLPDSAHCLLNLGSYVNISIPVLSSPTEDSWQSVCNLIT